MSVILRCTWPKGFLHFFEGGQLIPWNCLPANDYVKVSSAHSSYFRLLSASLPLPRRCGPPGCVPPHTSRCPTAAVSQGRAFTEQRLHTSQRFGSGDQKGAVSSFAEDQRIAECTRGAATAHWGAAEGKSSSPTGGSKPSSFVLNQPHHCLPL